MSQPLKTRDLGKRRFWGTAGFVGTVAGFVAMRLWKSDVLLVAGIALGLLGGLVIAAIRGSDEL